MIVEGQDDARFFDALMRARSDVGDQITFIDAKGKDRIGQILRSVANMRGFENVTAAALLRDADEDPDAAFRSMQAHLGSVLSNQPASPNVWHDAPGAVRVAAILVPMDAPGAIETLIWRCVPESWREATMRYVDEIDVAESPYALQFTESEAAKRKVYAIAAMGRREPKKIQPGLQIGDAAFAGIWQLEHDAINPYVRLLSAW